MDAGAQEVFTRLQNEIHSFNLEKEVSVSMVSDIGRHDSVPMVIVYPEATLYGPVRPDDVHFLVEEHLYKGRIAAGLQAPVKELTGKIAWLSSRKGTLPAEQRIVLERAGVIDPTSLDDYILHDGYQALGTVLTSMSPQDVIAVLEKSGLRGRGGAGFPTAKKWGMVKSKTDPVKFITCNADEGDPGAFMNRRVLEGDPHSVLEGMIIGAYAIGASYGYVYCRAEYPIAVKMLNIGIQQARALGLLGENIMGTGFSFDMEVRMGAGAFVCGEETALIASIEGKRGEPRPRPPFPADKGLWGHPTNNNNVETYANVPQIILKGADWFSSMGTEKSKGTKTFALASDVKNTGLIEVPLGITLRELVYEVGGGIKGDKKFKAAQIGGPAGGMLSKDHLDLKVDYESLVGAGAMMGSGGLVIMDEDTCMVDMARFFMDFIQDESCGKCTPCRVGTRRMLEILTRICEGKGQDGDIETLEMLCDQVRSTSLCGLGQGAPNPVASTLKLFREEYLAHIYEKRCPAKVCRGLISFNILDGPCTGCTVCARNCPVNAISGERKQTHVIDPDLCIRCGICKQVCNFDAVTIN